MIEPSIEPLVTRLVQQAPVLDQTVIAELIAALDRNNLPLARSIARVVTRVGAQQIEAGIALPALAMACATLEDTRLGDREREAARNEIETLLPVPDRPPRIVAPDVPLTRLTRLRRGG